MRHLGRYLTLLFFVVTSCTSDNTPGGGGSSDAGSDSGTDSGEPGISVSKASGNTTEAGGKATFVVKLDSAPTADVTLHFDSSNKNEGKVDKTSLTFTTDNWNGPQTVTVTGQDDMIADGDQAYQVVFSSTTSTDTRYASITPDPVKLSNVDNDSAGISVGAISGKTGEDGTRATFTVVLNTQPGADVTVHYDSDNTDEGTVDPGSLTFTMDNWNAPQTATVTGVDDSIADGDQKFHIVFSAATSMDARYAGMTPDQFDVTNVDNDSAGFTVSGPDGNTSEAGGAAHFTVKLKTQPRSDVTVHFDSSDSGEGTVDKTSLTFTSDNWNAEQTVTITGVDDDVADGDQAYEIDFGDTTSDDDNYSSMKPGTLHLLNTDNDSPGVLVSAISGDTAESGAQATFTVALKSQPTADVTISLGSSNTSEGVVDPASLTFTSENWNSAQTVTVTGVDDSLADGDQNYTITFAAAVSDDDNYNGMQAADVAVTNLDDDTNGITVSAISGTTGENGGQATFTVRLRTQPSGNVVVHFNSSDTTEGTVNAMSLTFTSVNWAAPQTVIVTGVDDNLDDGTQMYSITFTATTGADGYAGIVPPPVTVRNVDNDTAGVTVGVISGNTGEDGTQAHFTVVLNSQPSADVTVHFMSNNTNEGTTNRTSLIFTSVNWSAPQTVTVTGVDDSLADGRQSYAIVFTANTSSDTDYAAITPSQVNVNNVDNDTAGIIVSAISGNTGENGTQASFTVVLTSQPTADVVLTEHSDNTAEGTITPATMTFTTANWHSPKTVTVTGVQDNLADGNQTYHIVFDRAQSSDTNYAAITPAQVAVTNTDDDSPGINVSAISGDTDETGRLATFTVKLDSQPFSPVTVHFATNNAAEGTTGVTQLVFTAANWNAPQSVTVTGQNDAVADGDQPYEIVFSATTSGDSAYAGITPGNVDVTNDDDDSPGFNVSAISRNTREDGTQATFTVALRSQPTDDVTVNFASDHSAEGTTGVSSLTFTAVNWAAPQTVIVTGQNDNIADGDQPYLIAFSATTSNDPNYAAITPPSVAVTNVDDDTAGISVSLISGNTTEAGGQATFSVVLNSQPTDDVTLHFTSNVLTEGVTGVTQITFTPADWNATQIVTVTGVDDHVADGTQPYAITFSATTSSDTLYAAIRPGNVTVFNTDDDTAGINVSLISGPTTEAGGTAHFTVVLNSQPMSDVTVSFVSNDTTEGITDATMLTFTALNWNSVRTVTVTGQDDFVQDGSPQYRIVFSATTSADPAYAAITPNYVLVTNTDNDTAGFTFTPITGPTSEAGGTATFTIVLNSQPTDDVVVHYASSNPMEGTITGSGNRTFTALNWNAPKTVTITGVNDDVADGPQTYAIVFSATTSNDPLYNNVTPGNVTVINTDNDTAGINVHLVSGTTTEGGGQGSFTVALNSQPTANVTVNFASNRPLEGTPGATSLLFTPFNWAAAQTVTVTGQDDQVADSAQPYAIVFSATTSMDSKYSVLTPSNVSFSNTDNDSAGVNVTVISSTTSEAGGTATFTVALNSQPTASVTVNFASSVPTEGQTVGSLLFTTGNWASAQTVTVTGQDDHIADSNQPYSIVFGANTGSDMTYTGLTPHASIPMINTDDDTADIIPSLISRHTTEAGQQATFTVVLQSQPLADVTVHFASSNTAEGTVDHAGALTFTALNWNAAQTVTVTGQDDSVADGNQTYFINFTSISSSDSAYMTLPLPNHVVVVNDDNETADFVISTISGHTSEPSGTATFTIRLAVQPVGTVTIHYASTNSLEGTTQDSSKSFDGSNWSIDQTVTVQGVDDSVQDGPKNYAVRFSSITGSDAVYGALAMPPDVAVTNDDNDTAGFTVVVNPNPLHTDEGGGDATFTITLRSQPTDDVTIQFTSDNVFEGTTSSSPLTFTTSNWHIAQTVTVTGQDDSVGDGDQTYHVTFGSTTSNDPNYSIIKPADVTLINDDDETDDFMVSAISNHTSEAGNPATFTVVLTSPPTATVTLAYVSDTTSEGTVTGSPLTFTTANWNMAQTVTVTGHDDAVVDGSKTYHIVFSASMSTDVGYDQLTPTQVTVINDDDEDPCGAYGGTGWTLVASHVIVCNGFTDYTDFSTADFGDWVACTDTQWSTLTSGSSATIPDYLWLVRPSGACGAGRHEFTDFACQADQFSCYDPGAGPYCQLDSFGVRFALCQ